MTIDLRRKQVYILIPNFRVFNNIKELRTEELNSTVSTDDALQVKDATKDETEDSDCLNSSARKVDAQAHELETGKLLILSCIY